MFIQKVTWGAEGVIRRWCIRVRSNRSMRGASNSDTIESYKDATVSVSHPWSLLLGIVPRKGAWNCLLESALLHMQHFWHNLDEVIIQRWTPFRSKRCSMFCCSLPPSQHWMHALAAVPVFSSFVVYWDNGYLCTLLTQKPALTINSTWHIIVDEMSCMQNTFPAQLGDYTVSCG